MPRGVTDRLTSDELASQVPTDAEIHFEKNSSSRAAPTQRGAAALVKFSGCYLENDVRYKKWMLN